MDLDWATKESHGATLGRQARSPSRSSGEPLTQIAAAVAPQASLTAACGPALRQARILEHEKTTTPGLLAGHSALKSGLNAERLQGPP